MDWSYAGYMFGDADPPDFGIMADIKRVFGAKGDGRTDDTAAFELAITTIAGQGTIWVPKGVYRITRRLDIDRRIFIRGEGANVSVLYFPKSLAQVYGNNYKDGNSQYAFGPGFINFNGGDFPGQDTLLTTVTGFVSRGSRIIRVGSTARLHPRMVVRVLMDNFDNGLLADLNSGLVPPNTQFNNRVNVIRFASRIKNILNATHLELERLLPFNVSTAWAPELHAMNRVGPGVNRNFTGVSGLTFRFNATTVLPSENREDGYNGVYMFNTAHSFIKDVIFENADFGIALDGCYFTTIQNITFLNTSRPWLDSDPVTGSKGIWIKGGADNLVTDFNFRANMRRELMVSYFAYGNVFANGRGVDVDMEVLYGSPYANLFTNIHMGNVSNAFGWVVRGQRGASYNTFWNLRTNTSLALPPTTYAPKTTFVYTTSDTKVPQDAMDWWVEGQRVVTFPFNLHGAMRAARGRPLPPTAPVRYSGPGYGCLPNGNKCCTTGNATCPQCGPNAGTPSILFGCKGELWRPNNRITWDWGYAGYMAGSASVPVGVLPISKNIKTDFGAKGDGTTDDTQAVLNAISAMKTGVLYFPAGKYVLQSVINIRKHIVWRGDGKGKTILYFPKSLTDLYGNTWVEGSWVGTSQYSHGTGFINFGGWDPTGISLTRITTVTRNAPLGSRVVHVADTSKISVGQWVRVLQRDPGDGSLMRYLNGDVLWITDALRGYANPCRLLARVTRKGGNWIELERPLPYKVSISWTPEIHKFLPMLNGSTGLERMTILFKNTTYPGHFKELGWNGIHFNQLANAWIKDVEVLNGDLGFYSWGSVFTTIDGLSVGSTYSRGWFNGHRGVWMEHGSDNLFINFNISSRYVHDISMAGTEQGTVIMNGTGIDINMDHHRSAPFCNLFTNLHLGWGARPFDASGDSKLGTHCAMHQTFWNVRARMNMLLPTQPDFGPNMTFVGYQSTDPAASQYDWFVENLAQPYPGNLYDGMRSSRSLRQPVQAAS